MLKTVYRSGTGKDEFDTEYAIAHLEQGKAWLDEAISLAREGTIESFLDYFQVGYTSGNWHFPSIVTHYAHGIGNTLAKMMEEKILAGTGFHFKYSKLGPQEWYIYYASDEQRKKSEADTARTGIPHMAGRIVARIDIYNREVDMTLHIGDELRRIDKRKNDSADSLSEIPAKRQRLRESYERTLRRTPWWRIGKRRRQLDDALERHKQRIDSLEKVYWDSVSQAVLEYDSLIDLQSRLGILDRFKEYGFTINPAKSRKELNEQYRREHPNDTDSLFGDEE